MSDVGSGDDEPFDVHAVRHRLKLVRDAREGALYENRGDVLCPHCGDPFDELFLTDRSGHRFSPDRSLSFCVVREADRFLVCTHRRPDGRDRD